MKLTELIETKAGIIAACKLTKAEIADILLEISGEAQRQASSEKMPSDEEIGNANPYPNPIGKYQRGKAVGFVRGAKWLKQQINPQVKCECIECGGLFMSVVHRAYCKACEDYKNKQDK